MGCCQGKVTASEPKKNVPYEKDKNFQNDEPEEKTTKENGAVKSEEDEIHQYDCYSRHSPPPKTPRTPRKKKRKKYRKNPAYNSRFRSYNSKAERVYSADPACLSVVRNHPDPYGLTPRVDGYRPQENWGRLTTRSEGAIPEERLHIPHTVRSLQSKKTLSITRHRSARDYNNKTTPSAENSQLLPVASPAPDQGSSSYVESSLERSVTHIDLNLRPEVDSPLKRQERALVKLLSTSYCYRPEHPPGYLFRRQRKLVQERMKRQGSVPIKQKSKKSGEGVKRQPTLHRENSDNGDNEEEHATLGDSAN